MPPLCTRKVARACAGSPRSKAATRMEAASATARALGGQKPQRQKPPEGGFSIARRLREGSRCACTGAHRPYFLTASAALPAAAAASLAAPVAVAAASLAAPTASLATAAAPEATSAAALAAPAALEAAASATGAGAGAGAATGAGAGAGASAFLPQAARATAATREAKTSDLFMYILRSLWVGSRVSWVLFDSAQRPITQRRWLWVHRRCGHKAVNSADAGESGEGTLGLAKPPWSNHCEFSCDRFSFQAGSPHSSLSSPRV